MYALYTLHMNVSLFHYCLKEYLCSFVKDQLTKFVKACFKSPHFLDERYYKEKYLERS